MTKQYQDYFWKEGIPYGINHQDTPTGITFRISMDPYRKRISLEKYNNDDFFEVVYDSVFINFRKLQPMYQNAWEKKTVSKVYEKEVCHIRDQDNRIVLVETYYFKNEYCLKCRMDSPHGFYLATQKMFYESLGDPFNGVMLFDTNNNPVMGKQYSIDEETGLFTDIIKEEWNFGKNTFFDTGIRSYNP